MTATRRDMLIASGAAAAALAIPPLVDAVMPTDAPRFITRVKYNAGVFADDGAARFVTVTYEDGDVQSFFTPHEINEVHRHIMAQLDAPPKLDAPARPGVKVQVAAMSFKKV